MASTGTPAFGDKTIAKVFAAYPEPARTRLLALRAMIFKTAASLEEVGPIEETLKWGQPSYLTSATGSGTTVRIDALKSDETRVALYFHCQTGLVDTFRALYPQMTFEGNRAIVLGVKERLPDKALHHCIGLALTYHARKARKGAAKPAARPRAVRRAPRS